MQSISNWCFVSVVADCKPGHLGLLFNLPRVLELLPYLKITGIQNVSTQHRWLILNSFPPFLVNNILKATEATSCYWIAIYLKPATENLLVRWFLNERTL